MSFLSRGWQLLTGGYPQRDADLVTLWLPRVLEQIDPRLRFMPDYPRAYLDSIAAGLAYSQTLAQQVPGPLSVDRHAFAQDPTVHALFGSPQGIVDALIRSQDVGRWLHDRPGARQVYALLGVRRRDRQVLGMALKNEALQRDVPQTVTFFADHSFTNLAEDELTARQDLVRRFMDSLAGRVRDRIGQLQERRQGLLRARAEARDHPEERDVAGNGDKPAAPLDIQDSLDELGRSLALGAYPGHVAAVMQSPEEHLRLQSWSVDIDPMGLHAQADGADRARVHHLNLQEMVCRDRRLWNVMLVRCDLSEVPSYPQRLQSEARWLAI